MATKTIDHMDFYVAIAGYQLPSVPDQTFNSLRVSVGYRKGSGFYASFHPGWGDGSMWGCMFDFSKDPLSAGMTVDVVPAEKNNAKRIAEMTESLKMAKDIIAALFDDREWQKLKGVLQNAARSGYTDAFKEQAEKYLAERVSKRYEKAVKPTEPVVKQVDVMGLMGALQTKGKAKLSNFAKPIESESNEKENNSNQETMAQNVKAADLIGKEIIMGTTGAKYVVKSVDEDKLICDFENPTQGMSSKDMPVPFANVQKFIAGGKWTVADANEAATTDVTTEADVQEVQDIVPVVTPKGKDNNQEPITNNQPAAKVEPIKATVKPEPKPKAKDVKPETKGGKYAYATYQTKKGKTGAKIAGFASEDDVFYAMAAEIHASGSYERDKQGNKHYYLCFGPRYAEAAKSICKVLNSDKTVNQKVAECKLIVSQTTEELATKREEWKQKREERKAQAENKPKAEKPAKGEKTYTQTELAEWLRKLNSGTDKEKAAAAKFFNDLAKAA